MGVSPVIISNGYLLPEGPDWAAFAVIMDEKHIGRLPQVRSEKLGLSQSMGRLARLAWEEWFSPEKIFNHIVDSCAVIRQRRLMPERTYHIFWTPLVLGKRSVWTLRRALRNAILRTARLLGVRLAYDPNA